MHVSPAACVAAASAVAAAAAAALRTIVSSLVNPALGRADDPKNDPSQPQGIIDTFGLQVGASAADSTTWSPCAWATLTAGGCDWLSVCQPPGGRGGGGGGGGVPLHAHGG